MDLFIDKFKLRETFEVKTLYGRILFVDGNRKEESIL
jgi:hypothetical protein